MKTKTLNSKRLGNQVKISFKIYKKFYKYKNFRTKHTYFKDSILDLE